ncbi:hypothetical protein BZA05DRAFT_402959 [Tricharina praecox]|uniref:uncharacterized protein n=1 Tax=Tricharina praecox TaxID=43433 RepID=UPI00221F311E|nr:uncharacterized protein BZA05DRAFT_402959 [Tricharina praecox]KAI5848862.1 hypothetical protein BZA05DRAFT_402959 [Tricharina praecox]
MKRSWILVPALCCCFFFFFSNSELESRGSETQLQYLTAVTSYERPLAPLAPHIAAEPRSRGRRISQRHYR